jgi:hypothetical protein
MRALATGSVVVAVILLLATPAFSQSAVAGVVRDSSGVILPGVSVEAASPVLIEKSRTVVTDGSGQYRIVDLEPGTYTVTFTLPGFATIRREGIELTGAGVTTINADLRVGAVEETVTVTGATPVVDTQTSTKREVVLSDEVLAAVPVTRTYGSVLAMVPGVPVGGTATNFFFTSRGGRGVRCVRERQDVPEGELQQVPGNSAERRPLYHQQSGSDVPADHEPELD